jgi:hypothetical protein
LPPVKINLDINGYMQNESEVEWANNYTNTKAQAYQPRPYESLNVTANYCAGAIAICSRPASRVPLIAGQAGKI